MLIFKQYGLTLDLKPAVWTQANGGRMFHRGPAIWTAKRRLSRCIKTYKFGRATQSGRCRDVLVVSCDPRTGRLGCWTATTRR